VNQAVMRMAINLAIRRLNVLFDHTAPTPRPAPPPPPPTGGPISSDGTRVARTQEMPIVPARGGDYPAERSTDKSHVRRMYRGRPVGDPE
jgi:hypothetical protein